MPLRIAGAQVIWTGLGVLRDWDYVSGGIAANWSNGLVPDATATVTFGSGFASGDPNLNGSRTIAGLALDTAQSFSLTGIAEDTLSLSTGRLTRSAESSGVHTIDVPVKLGSVGTWTISGQGQMVMTKGIYEDERRDLYKFGNGTLSITGEFAHTGITVVREGVLRLQPTLASEGRPLNVFWPGEIRASGFVPRRLGGDGSLRLLGDLSIGNAGTVNGVFFNGSLNVGSHSLHLLDGDAAYLTGSVTMDGGRISSSGDLVFAGPGQLQGSGTITSDFQSTMVFTGYPPGLFLDGDVTTTNSIFGNVHFNGSFSAGRPGEVGLISLSNPRFNSRFVVDVAGVGSCDLVTIINSATFGGVLAVNAVNGFMPLPGQSFLVATFPSRVGTFQVSNATEFDGLRFRAVYELSRLFVVAEGLAGDADLNGTVNIGDFARLASNFNLQANWTNGDFNNSGFVDSADFALLAANFNQSLTADPPRQGIPEPAALAGATFVTILLQKRNRKC